MREIKFRAWHKDIGYMEDSYALINILTGEIEASRYHESEDTPNMIVMQFTGLEDKNGTEIYEGDIVKGLLGSDKDKIFEIEYNAPYFLLKNGCLIGADSYQYYKIIGNIYENSELLKALK